jgi:hypothetical protein
MSKCFSLTLTHQWDDNSYITDDSTFAKLNKPIDNHRIVRLEDNMAYIYSNDYKLLSHGKRISSYNNAILNYQIHDGWTGGILEFYETVINEKPSLTAKLTRYGSGRPIVGCDKYLVYGASHLKEKCLIPQISCSECSSLYKSSDFARVHDVSGKNYLSKRNI